MDLRTFTLTVRTATLADLDGIERVEAATFGRIDPNAAASPGTIRHRINLLNAADPTWFLVAVAGSLVVGTLVLQPTDLEPADCTSWEAATDGGTLDRSFN